MYHGMVLFRLSLGQPDAGMGAMAGPAGIIFHDETATEIAFDTVALAAAAEPP